MGFVCVLLTVYRFAIDTENSKVKGLWRAGDALIPDWAIWGRSSNLLYLAIVKGGCEFDSLHWFSLRAMSWSYLWQLMFVFCFLQQCCCTGCWTKRGLVTNFLSCAVRSAIDKHICGGIGGTTCLDLCLARGCQGRGLCLSALVVVRSGALFMHGAKGPCFLVK